METADPLVIIQQSQRRLTVDEYHRMIDAGIFDEDDKVELLAGVLVEMTPQSGRHAYAIQILTGLLVRGVGPGFDVRVQLPLTVSDASEPEPDFAVVPAGTGAADAHPTTALLVVEVSRASLARDRAVKAPLYARAGVNEYWIVNLDAAEVEVFRDPDSGAGRYRASHTVDREGELNAVALPGVRVKVSAMLTR